MGSARIQENREIGGILVGRNVQVMGINLVDEGSFRRPGEKRLMTVLVWVKPHNHIRLSTAQVPLEIWVEGASRPVFCEALGMVANASGHLYAHVALSPGLVRIGERDRETPRWSFRWRRAAVRFLVFKHGRRNLAHGHSAFWRPPDRFAVFRKWKCTRAARKLLPLARASKF